MNKQVFQSNEHARLEMFYTGVFEPSIGFNAADASTNKIFLDFKIVDVLMSYIYTTRNGSLDCLVS